MPILAGSIVHCFPSEFCRARTSNRALPPNSLIRTLMIKPFHFTICIERILTAFLSSGLLLSGASMASEKTEAPLPISEIILYSSGVGYFQRDGQVEGRATVDLLFKTDEINDLLKSLVVQDLDGGQVSAVTYSSRDPLTKTLKSFGIDLTSNPTLAQLLHQLRGQSVEVLRPGSLIGTIIGVERKTERLDDNRTVETDYLNLLTDDGLLTMPLAQAQRIRLLDQRLNTEFQQALAVLAASQDTQKKAVAITFDGQGQRSVSVAYIAQTPVWKTTYRLVLDEKEAPYLQGWAIVENTSDDDWEQVRMSLVSGRPISFAMDLYQPLYTTRPVVQPELYTSLAPQVYGDALGLQAEEAQLQAERFGLGLGGGGFAGRQQLERAARPAGPLPKAHSGAMPSPAAAPPMADVRGFYFSQTAVSAAAQGAQAGELFQYAIKTPVTLARQKSAMLPIVSQRVEGQKLSIYNEQVQPKYPLNGFRLKNSTDLHLMQGPVTVFDAGAYAGDARLDDLASGQDRLISYALDLKTEIEPQSGAGQQELVTVKIRKGTLLLTRRVNEEKTYRVRNRDQKQKTVLIEHPFRQDWELVEPKQADERTREVHRFIVKAEPDKTARLVVREEKQLTETVQLINSHTDLISFYIKSQKTSPEVKQALEKLVALRDRLNRTSMDRGRREERVREVAQEQSRIRENMTRLSQTSELYNRYVKTLDRQETELEDLRREIESLKSTEAQQQNELNDYLLNLEVE
jgi:hypothetical protein